MGHNELLVSEALREVDREQVLLSVKFGALRSPDNSNARSRRTRWPASAIPKRGWPRSTASAPPRPGKRRPGPDGRV
jgi:aryl-alcohol dehydrogenase-like predicted oxidoreductase